jgi:hypothetical protein
MVESPIGLPPTADMQAAIALFGSGPEPDILREIAYAPVRAGRYSRQMDQPPEPASIISPNRSHVSPLNLIICTWEMGAKSVADVLILTLGTKGRPAREPSCWPPVP